MKLNLKSVLPPLLLVLLLMIHCGEAGTRVGNPPTTITNVYPTSFAITSPLSFQSATASVNLLPSSGPLALSSFSETTTAINNILTGTEPSDCVFDPEPLLRPSQNADCYGPVVNYSNHPDSNLPNSGQLPSGDVGLWTKNEADTGEACSAAQQNERIAGVSDKADVILKALASMICIANVTGVDLPAAGETINLTADMTAVSSSFSNATLSQSTDPDTGNDVYTYTLEFTFTPVDNDQINAMRVTVGLEHMPLAETGDADTNDAPYRGKFTYQYDWPLSYKCLEGHALSSVAGSTLYHKTSATALAFDAAWAIYCGGLDERDESPFTANRLLDPTQDWTDNYSRFLANFNPENLSGNYAYAWQAGHQDSHSRVFNLHINSDETLTGDAFYGYGPHSDTTEFDGRISGFICNWAAPGNNNHVLLDLVQHQSIAQSVTGVFTEQSSNIRYAPTNSCNYTASQTDPFSFDYDSDNNSIIDQNNPSQNLTHELKTAADNDGDGYLDVITDAGFTLPVVED
ncbi:MAG: hypothetical protein HQM16_00910 [Deltaproteobacteria bacterium]|nr:hypothetical protein [Deltaproteobacteria bacterium]